LAGQFVCFIFCADVVSAHSLSVSVSKEEPQLAIHLIDFYTEACGDTTESFSHVQEDTTGDDAGKTFCEVDGGVSPVATSVLWPNRCPHGQRILDSLCALTNRQRARGRQCSRLRSLSISLKTSPDALDAPVAPAPEARLMRIRGVPRRRHRGRGSEVFLKHHGRIYILTTMEAAVSRGVVVQRLRPLGAPNWRCR